MPITTEYNGEFIQTQTSGLISLPDLMAYATEVERIEAAQPVTPHRIAHLTSGTVNEVNPVELHAFASKRQAAVLKNPVKSAIVAGDAVQYDLARMLQTLNAHPDIHIEVFQSGGPALAWLRE